MNGLRGWLDVVGFLEGTLKSSSWVDILRHYERHFAEYRDQEIEVLEIGVNSGASLTVWKKYFSKARFIGVDINAACARFKDERTSIEIGSQDDPSFLSDLTKKYSPTIIIDDGSHLAHHIPFTFERLYPALPPGGLYVIEDMFFHFPPHSNGWLGHSKTPAVDYFFDAVRLLFTEQPGAEESSGFKAHLKATVEEVSFAPIGVAFIRKAAEPPSLADRIAMAQEYAEDVGTEDVWRRLAEYLLRQPDKEVLAVAAAKRAVKIAPQSVPSLLILSWSLRRNDDIEGAISAVEAANEIDANNWQAWDFLGQLHALRTDNVKAKEAFHHALSLRPGDVNIQNRLSQIKAE